MPGLTAAILAPVAGSQVVSRWLLRDAKQFLARRLRYLADFILGLSPIMVLTLLGFELLVMIGLVEPRVAGICTLIIAGGIAVLGVLIAITPVVRKVSFSSDALAAPLRFVQITDVHIGVAQSLVPGADCGEDPCRQPRNSSVSRATLLMRRVCLLQILPG